MTCQSSGQPLRLCFGDQSQVGPAFTAAEHGLPCPLLTIARQLVLAWQSLSGGKGHPFSGGSWRRDGSGKGMRTGGVACRGRSAAQSEAPPVHPSGSRLCPNQAPGWEDSMWGTWAPWRESPAPGVWATAARVLGAEGSADVAAAWPRSQMGDRGPLGAPCGDEGYCGPGAPRPGTAGAERGPVGPGEQPGSCPPTVNSCEGPQQPACHGAWGGQ